MLDLKTRIRIVLLMAELKSTTLVIRALKSEGMDKPPTRWAIEDLYDKFCSFGTVLDLPRSGRPKISSEESTDLIAEILEENPRSTLTQLSASTSLSRSTIQRRIKKEIGLKPYKIQILQELFEEDYDMRVEMAEVLIPLLQDPALKDLIFFSDEANFHLSGRVHKQNCRIWAEEKPIEVDTEPLHSPKIIVWCAMSSKCIIGPFFFEESTVNGQNYLKMLQEYLNPILVRKRIQRRVIFQQDGAPPHFDRKVREWLNQKFPGKWIGRRGPIEWAPRSPDLTPLDFFLWGYLKQKVYSTPVPNLAELKRRITEHIELIEPDVLESVFFNLEKRLFLVKEKNGRHIEHLI